MASQHDALMTSGGELIADVFGEPVEQEATVLYRRPDAVLGKRLDRVSIFNRRAAASFEINEGTMVRMERRAIGVDVAQLAALGVTGVEERAFVTLPDGEWAIDADATVWGGTRVKLGLKREIGTGFGERRYGDA